MGLNKYFLKYSKCIQFMVSPFLISCFYIFSNGHRHSGLSNGHPPSPDLDYEMGDPQHEGKQEETWGHSSKAGMYLFCFVLTFLIVIFQLTAKMHVYIVPLCHTQIRRGILPSAIPRPVTINRPRPGAATLVLPRADPPELSPSELLIQSCIPQS